MAKIKTYIPYIVALALCAFVAIPVASNDIIMDEGYSILLVRKSVWDIIKGTAGDVHPPLYYLILKFFSLFSGESLLVYRVATALATWLNLILLGATLIRKRWGTRVSLIYMLWFGLTYCTIERSTTVRMYSWGAFFVTAAALFLFFYYESQSKKDLAWAIVFTLGAMYTHYYALLAVFVSWALLSVVTVVRKKKISKVLIGGVLVAIGYLPWLGILLTQFGDVAEDYWIKVFDWNEWMLVPTYLMESPVGELSGIGTVLQVLILLMLIPAFVRKKWDALSGAAVFLGTMVFAAVVSVVVTPIWVTRYMYVAWGVLSLFVAIVAGEMVSKYSNIIQGIFMFVLLLTGLHSYTTMMADETMTSTADEWVAFLQENIDENSYVIYDDPLENRLVYEYYMPETELICVTKLRKNGLNDSIETLLEENKDKQIWYIINYRLQRVGVDKIGAAVEEAGYTMEREDSFIIKEKTIDVFRVEEAK